MKEFREYWTFLAIRGAVTLLAAGILAGMPFAAAAIVTIPVALLLTVDCLAAFSFFDGGVMVLLRYLLPSQAKRRNVLFAQVGLAAGFGAVLFLMAYGVVGVGGVLKLVAVQAILAAVAEWFVARDTHRQYECASCYSTAMVLAACAVGLAAAPKLTAEQTVLALAGYVAAYGASQLVMGVRMLFVEYRAEHPARVASQAWRLAMDGAVREGAAREGAVIAPVSHGTFAGTPFVATQKAAADCSTCAAAPLCGDLTLEGQVALLSAERRPSLVRATRVGELLRTA